MFYKFQRHIEQNFPFILGKKVLIAISGGVDSVVLTHLVTSLHKIEVALAHCNFKLRGKASDLDEKFVKKLGKELSLTTHITFFNTEKYSKKHKLSIQVAARTLRYDWFNQLVKNHSYDYILTAHHTEDNLETFLINLTRGTGLEGLTGIPEKKNNIIRPLLVFSKEEIKEYAFKNAIEWREDNSNSEIKYLRNFIRHKIVNELKQVNPEILNNFKKTIANLQQTNQIVKDRVEQVAEKIVHKENNVVKINIKKTLELSNPKAYLYQLLKGYGFKEWSKVYELLLAQSGKFITTKSYRLVKDREFLLISHTDNEVNCKKNCFFTISEREQIAYPVDLKVEKSNFLKIECENSILIDKNLVNFPLFIRKRKNGDLFFPTGMRGRKKVSKYFKDEKLSLIDKENTWLLCSGKDDIIWIIGMRQDRRFIANNKTKNIIKISTKIPDYE